MIRDGPRAATAAGAGAAAGGAMNVRVLGADLLTVHIPDDREMPVTFLQARLKRCRRTAK
jgi:hypothetical protein